MASVFLKNIGVTEKATMPWYPNSPQSYRDGLSRAGEAVKN
jgi:hypothetical protein